MKSRIFYLMSGPAHLPYLVCSLRTLRRHYQGEIVVFAWEESFQMAKQIAEDSRLGPETSVRLREPEYRGKNAQFVDKMACAMEQAEVDRVLYLDADTTIHGKIDPLLDLCDWYSFVATQFNDWTTKGGVIQRRLDRLKDYLSIDQHFVEAAIQNDHPSLNGGIWACRPGTPVLPLWRKWTLDAKDIFIADEVVLHLMPLVFGTSTIGVYPGGKYNCSAIEKFQPANLADSEVIVRHYHGDSNTRVNKSEKGVRQWATIYKECLDENVGGIRDWGDQIKNKYLKAMLESELWAEICG